MAFEPIVGAREIVAAHAERRPYANLQGAARPGTIAEAYAIQEALPALWKADRGPVAGLKIATTTKVMQQLMGIDHPCGGMIYEHAIRKSPARVSLGDFMHLMIECELAVLLGSDLPESPNEPYTRESVRPAIAAVMPAFELIEDRCADYKATEATSLIADNAWNGGIVLGAEVALPPSLDLNGIAGQLSVNGSVSHQGLTDDPLGALAWLANLAISRRRPMQAGMVVITGSVIPTVPIAAGDAFVFGLAGLGAAEMVAQ